MLWPRVCLNISRSRPAGLSHGSERAGIVVKTLPDNEGGTPLVSNALRVSHHVFNDEDELARFVAELTAALDDVCAARR